MQWRQVSYVGRAVAPSDGFRAAMAQRYMSLFQLSGDRHWYVMLSDVGLYVSTYILAPGDRCRASHDARPPPPPPVAIKTGRCRPAGGVQLAGSAGGGRSAAAPVLLRCRGDGTTPARPSAATEPHLRPSAATGAVPGREPPVVTSAR